MAAARRTRCRDEEARNATHVFAHGSRDALVQFETREVKKGGKCKEILSNREQLTLRGEGAGGVMWRGTAIRDAFFLCFKPWCRPRENLRGSGSIGFNSDARCVPVYVRVFPMRSGSETRLLVGLHSLVPIFNGAEG